MPVIKPGDGFLGKLNSFGVICSFPSRNSFCQGLNHLVFVFLIEIYQTFAQISLVVIGIIFNAYSNIIQGSIKIFLLVLLCPNAYEKRG